MRSTHSALLAMLVSSLIWAASPPQVAAGRAQPGSRPLSVGSSVQAVGGEYLIEAGAELLAQLADLNPVELGFGIYRISDPSTEFPADRAAQLSTKFGVVVEPNILATLVGVNSEPDAAQQWYLDNTGQSGGTPDSDIDGPEAWDASTGAGTVIAILDTGADLDHPDIAPNLWTNPGEIAGNGIDDDSNGFIDDVNGWDFVNNDSDPQDFAGGETGHGTSTSSVAAGALNGVGMAGVAPDAKIMVLRVCGIIGCLDADVVAALAYAAANGASVANLSFSQEGPRPTNLETAVGAAIDAGVTVVAAAGNGGLDMVGDDTDILANWPASFEMPGLISVAATDRNDGLAGFSNFGLTTVDLGAPGVSIYAADSDDAWSSVSGTSFSAPMTAGVAALVVSSDPCLTPSQVEGLVRDRGDKIASLDGKTVSGRRLNALKALWTSAAGDDAVAGSAPFVVTFPGGGAATLWDFDDGETSTGIAPYHAFDFGLYSVTNDSSSTVFEVAAGLSFTDLCTSVFRTEIIWLSAAGITSGCASGEFCPKDDLTRAQMATFLASALQLPAATQDYFDDDDGNIHEANINRLAEANISAGCTVTEFCPNDSVTRAQTATFFARGFGLSGGSDAFTDDGGSVHEPNINALALTGITSGCAAGLFCPNDPITREQMAAFFFRGRDFLPG